MSLNTARAKFSAQLSALVLCFAFGLTFCCLPGRALGQDANGQDNNSAADNGEAKAAVQAGHSYHGETFNEGPRQKAYLMGGTGDVKFPATSSHSEVQPFINQGVGQLHGFWYLEAERSFRQAAALDPDCAIAYWGAAMANRNNTTRARGFIAEAVKRKDKASKREQIYIDALNAFLKEDEGKDDKEKSENKKKRAENYTQALEDIIYQFPEDLEARAFLALQLYDNRGLGIPITSYYAIDALLQDLFEKVPLHPAHHFCIHLWDLRHAELALKSAARCGQSAPSIAHMWHMPGHIFSRLNRYEDAAWQQEASARTDHAHMMHDKLLPDEIFNFAHNNEWLIRNLMFVGRVDEAINLAKNMIELPQHPKYNTMQKRGSMRYGRDRLFEALVDYQRWDDLIKLADTVYLEPTDDQDEQIKRLKYLASACFMTGQDQRGENCLSELQAKLDELKSKQQDAVNKAVEEVKAKAATEQAEKKPAEQPEAKQEQPADPQPTSESPQPEQTQPEQPKPEQPQPEQVDEELKKKIDEATKNAQNNFASQIRNLEKSIDVANGYRAFKQADFKTAAEKLKSGGEDSSLILEARFLAGEREAAIEEINKEAGRRKSQVIPAARRVFMLNDFGKIDEAKAAFEDLRNMSGSIDMQSSLFTRLIPIGQEFGLGQDWRVARTIPDDVGQRPALDSLGPIHWRPTAAPEWSLVQADGVTRSSKEFAGKPVILIFYLGYGCLHCAEQLQKFSPHAKDFEQAGISMLAISSDDAEGLQKSIKGFEGELHIPLLSDGNLDVFKAFRAYDDFENLPLHGTFFIDGDGKVRWQDIGFEPFMDHEFLLKESQRLLAQKNEGTAPENKDNSGGEKVTLSNVE